MSIPIFPGKIAIIFNSLSLYSLQKTTQGIGSLSRKILRLKTPGHAQIKSIIDEIADDDDNNGNLLASLA